MKNSEEEKSLEVLKDNLRSYTTGTDDDLSIDIQDAIGRDPTLSLIAGNIQVTVEGEIVTLVGEVYREEEKLTIGNIAMNFAGDDNVNNYLRVMGSSN